MVNFKTETIFLLGFQFLTTQNEQKEETLTLVPRNPILVLNRKELKEFRDYLDEWLFREE